MDSDSPGFRELHAATQTVRARIDGLAYSQQAAAGTLAIARYASFLRALHAVYSELEHTVATSPLESLRSSPTLLTERRSELARDLANLGVDRNGVDAPVLRALVLGQWIRLDTARAPEALIGHLYALEAAQLQCVTLSPEFTRRSELRSGGLRYLASKADRTLRLADFDPFIASVPAREHAILAAQHALEGIEAILGVLATGQYDDVLAGALNPDAGTHPVPTDVREVQAALAAGERSREDWPYYEARYGERGLRFTRSDSAWLVTLAREGADTAKRQITWLGRVLATRGMPRYLLESHLRVLREQLVASVPERAAEYDVFEELAKQMASERHAVLSDTDFEKLARGFVGGSGGPLADYEAGTLLVAAVMDERCGIDGAVESLCRWLDEPARVSQQWRDAVQRTLVDARG
jgi:heme oxygenase